MRVTVPTKFIGAKKRGQFWLLVILTLFAYTPTTFAIVFNPASVKGMAQAYGFVLGQEYSLSRISKEFPELAANVDLARAQFDSTFPDIKTKLETQLKKAMGEKLFEEASTDLQRKFQETAGRHKITLGIATSFLEEVKSRSKGVIESPALEYLLSVKYDAHPVGEFADGFRQRYQTNGTGKSQEIKLKLQLPRSWAAKEGERPHIVQKWISQNGTGLEMMHLDIRDTEGHTASNADVEIFVSSGEVKGTVPSGGTYIDSGLFLLEKRKGYWIEMSLVQERAGIKSYLHSSIHQIFFRGKAIGLMCQTWSSIEERAKADEAFKKIKPLCQQVLNSLVLLQAY